MIIHLCFIFHIFQLPNVKSQLEKMNHVLRTDLSAVVQKVSPDQMDICM